MARSTHHRNGTEGPPLSRRELIAWTAGIIVFLLVLGIIGAADNALLGAGESLGA